MADRGPVAAALEGLPARVWALLLRELRGSLADLAERTTAATSAGRAELTERCAGPRSAVAAGPGRAAVAGLLAADPELRAHLAARPALADAVPALRADAVDGAGVPADPDPGPGAPDRVDADPNASAADVVRELRGTVAALRRQRDGADARARSAERRADDLATELATVRAELAAAEGRIGAAAAERERAVDRASRRTEDRLRALGAELAAERREGTRLGRELERERERVTALEAEVARLAAVPPAAPGPAAGPVLRPVGLPDGVAPDTTEAARHLLGAVGLVVVDGYNLTLRARAGLDLADQRRWLLDRLRPVAARGVRVVVVFDGDRRTATRRRDAGVDVRFTSDRDIADDEIEFVAGEAAVGGTPTLVVTDDAELRRRVGVHDADVVGVLPFTGALG